MNRDILKNLIKNVDCELFKIVNNLVCSICQELFYKPVTTPCGHSFCSRCIKRALSSKDNSGCPLCKNPVTRYGLETDELMSTLTEICQELPVAFENDVRELTNNFMDLEEDLIKTSKLSQIHNQEYAKDSNNKKQKSIAKEKIKVTDELKDAENDLETFIPVLKRTENVLEYAGAKKKKINDLVSVSQTEPASNSSLCDTSELDKNLLKIEKINSEKKISEWLSSVGDYIYLNSPNSSILDNKKCFEDNRREKDKPTMLRRDYNKSRVCLKNNEEVDEPVDPYEFVSSQSNKVTKKKLKKRSTWKKIQGFKALKKFSKESIKRSSILLGDSKEEVDVEEEMKSMTNEKQITASQKFDQLLSETKMEEKKPHALYSASQSSSTQFLDISFHSKIEKVKNKKTPRVRKKVTEEKNILFKNVTEGGNESRSSKSKRRRSAHALKSEKRKKLLVENIDISGVEESQLEKSAERYLIASDEKINPPSTKLGTLLKELLDDDMIYATRPANAPVRLPDLGVIPDDEITQNHPERDVTQNTKLIGFCTQEETLDEKIFKKMVENMEKELNSSECVIKSSKQTGDCQSRDQNLTDKNPKRNASISEGENNSYVSPEPTKEIQKNRLVEFLHLGRLTPIRKRTKSTVVKLVFPIGLTSLARRRPLERKCVSAAQIPKKQTSQVSTGIQTSQSNISSFVQTSQVPQFSVNLQTSQEVRPSVEIQTTQKLTSSAEIQTSQRLVCQEIQTTQIESESMQVQTTPIQCQLSPNSVSKMPETPDRKLSHQHRKVIQKKTSEESLLSIFHNLPEKQPPVDKDLVMNFGTDRGLEKTWRSTQKHEHLVELRNQKNKEQSDKTLTKGRRKSTDADSDDADIHPTKKRSLFKKILSETSTEIPKDYETRQLIPLDVRKVSEDEEMEIINLDTPGSQNSEEQMLLVLKNIDLDLRKGRSGNVAKGEKSEESDSDILVEQTPPRCTSWINDDIKNLSRIRCESNSVQKEREVADNENREKQNSEETDLVEDSLPKGFSESFLLLSAPQKIPLISEKNSKSESPKKGFKTESAATIDLPNENDQNQLNAFEGQIKMDHLKAAVDAWTRTGLSPSIKTTSPRKLCIVASSVKNQEMIKKFVNRFKTEYLNKPTKSMTHLIVGLHENDDKELLPLCTPKLLFAMANKKWVVSELWAETCLKMDVILPEETFETLDPVGGCGCRKARLSNEKLLKNCEIYLLGDFQMISKEDFADLIVDCGGTMVPTPEKFSFSLTKLRMIIADRECLTLSEKQLQELYQRHSTAILSRDVIIMSIQSYKVINLYPYLLHPASEESLVKLGYPLSLVKNEDDTEEDEGEYSSRSVAR